MNKIVIELDNEVVDKAFVQSMDIVKHDMVQQLRYIERLREKGLTTPYMGIFDDCMDQDEDEIKEFIKALVDVRSYYAVN
jgi:hypothetical protein